MSFVIISGGIDLSVYVPPDADPSGLVDRFLPLVLKDHSFE
jgi:hypothetical protein